MANDYEVYKTPLTKKDYFDRWEDDKLQSLTDDLMNHIYEKYLVKCHVMIRDGFKCQNVECQTPESELTMHHIKWQKNGGENKVRNCITLCKSCHKAFHRGKREIVYPDVDYLPSHIRGATHTIKGFNEINWKKLKKEMRIFRKSLNRECGIRLSWDQVQMLMKFLQMEFNDEDD